MQKLKQYIFLLVILIGTQNSYAQTNNAASLTNSDSINFLNYDPNQNIRLADSVINFSKKYLGSPYRGGGKGPNSFDCSGFTSFVFNNFGIRLGSSSADQAEQLPSICTNDIQPGDLVFYNGRSRGHRVGHVGMVVSKNENGDFAFIHSASSVGISISNSNSNYYQKRFVKAARILKHDSLLVRTFSKPELNLALTNTPSSNFSSSTESEHNYKTVRTNKNIPAKFHTVKSGETLSGIASKYGVTVSQLKKQNRLSNDFLALKQRVKITEAKKITIEEKVAVAITESPINNEITKSESVSDKPKIHIISKGETLFSISKKYGISVRQLEELNQLEKGKLFPGHELKLDTPENAEKLLTNEEETIEKEEKTVARADTKKTPKQNSKSHTVKKGESLSEIAEKYHCTIREIKSWNAKNSNKINAGEKLKIKI